MTKPSSITLRAYQVGFGDCFLLTFHYENDEKRHILIDFGSTGLPDGFPKDQMLRVAQDIAIQCGGKLAAVVGTHRHKDHISGFSTQGKKNKDGKTTGDIIRELNPSAVIMPWTEQPDLKTDATKPKSLTSQDEFKKSPNMAFVATLQDMQSTSRAVKSEAERLSSKQFVKPLNEKISKHLSFMGENNLANLSAVKNLQDMAKGGKGHYVYYHSKLDLSSILPGVKITVLGPPTLEQYEKIANQRSTDKDEFWMLHAIHKNYWGMQAATTDLLENLNENENTHDRIFPEAGIYKNFEPSQTRWFTRRIRDIRAEQLMGLVRILDDAMNNTSVILLFEVNDKKLLFPGDAQIENWEFALKHAPEKDSNLKLLKGTMLYKVGHHGSRNATPKTLWKTFGRKMPDRSRDESIHTVNSTMPGKHGHTPETAVPRATLVEDMKGHSRYHTTEEIKKDSEKLFVEISI